MDLAKSSYLLSMRVLIEALENHEMNASEISELGDIYRALFALQQSAMYEDNKYEKWRIKNEG